MKAAAANLEFEKAASLRDRIKQLQEPRAGSGSGAGADVAPKLHGMDQGGRSSKCRSTSGSSASVGRAAWSRRPIYYRDIVEQFDSIGIGSLTVVLLDRAVHRHGAGAQFGFTLDQFGARSMVGRLVSASMVRELGPVLTGLMVAGRVGSGIAAELGSMIGDRSDRRAARARHRSGAQAGRAARCSPAC